VNLATPYYDHVAAVDFETFWAKDFTLTSKKMSMTDYIRSERFEAQTCALRMDNWPEAQSAVGAKQISELLHSVDWNNTAMLGHHTQFDGLIATHWFDIWPVFWLDNMAISRAVYGADVAHSHAALAARLGIKAKSKGDALKETCGKYLREMPLELIEHLAAYNRDDADEEFQVFLKIKDYLPLDELRIIDLTIRMYCEPILELDEARLRGLHTREVDRRARLIEDAETTQTVLGSAPKFADLLRSLGVVPPMKKSPRTGLPTYAFAKTDLEFKALLQHPDEAVRKAVEARLGNKGSIVETRSKRLIERAGLPTPVYLAYGAARTLRWGGGDLCNWQNLPSTGDGANLRRAILAPEGTKIIGGDASQVEARMAAWLAGHEHKLEAFKLYDAGLGPDMYCIGASDVFGRTITKENDPFERFIGKVLELSCQYGAGPTRVQHSLRQGFRGAPPIDMPLHEVKANVERWRKVGNHPLVQYWRRIELNAQRAWLQGVEIEDGPLTFELFKGDGYIHLPNGTFMKYTAVGWDNERRSLYYNSKLGSVKLWGGHLLENVSQALCAVLLKWQLLQLIDRLPYLRVALLVHDEVVSVADNDAVEEYKEIIKDIMSTPAPWATGLPLNAAVSHGEYYDKA
jgi:hypothetical protein